jgi:hypothetical protein
MWPGNKDGPVLLEEQQRIAAVLPSYCKARHPLWRYACKEARLQAGCVKKK